MDVDANSKPAAGHEQRLKRIVRVTLILLFVLAMIRVFVFEPYAIPTGSMRPTILEGDVLLVNKLPYVIRTLRNVPFTSIPLPHLAFPGTGTLERGDVVVFDFPSESPGTNGSGEQFVKRCVATPGDTVQLQSGRIRVNGVEVPSYGSANASSEYQPSYLPRRAAVDARRAFALIRYGGAVVVPFAGLTVALDSIAAARWSSTMRSEGATVEYRNRIVFINGLPATNYTFRRDYFFALGDNSSDSHDSRYFGFVPVENLIGQAWLVYWSRNPNDGIRWDRIGTMVR